jgi:hypothetical protein
MVAFVSNTMQFVETVWERYVRSIMRGAIQPVESILTGLQEVFVLLDRVLSDPECESYVRSLAAELTKSVEPGRVRAALDQIVDFIGPHCMGVFSRDKESIAQTIIGQKEERAAALVAAAFQGESVEALLAATADAPQLAQAV